MRVVITGATGLIGQHLVPALIDRGFDVVVFTRSPQRAHALFQGTTENIQWPTVDSTAPWPEALNDADAVIHLAGESIAKRWTKANQRRILDSRVVNTRLLVDAMRLNARRPSVLISGSAVGFYGPAQDWVDESSPPAEDFLSHVVQDWEQEAFKATSENIRVVTIRTGVVLSPEGGVLSRMLIPFRLFVGGSLGSGKQWLPWIHREDWIRLVLLCLEDTRAEGPINGAAPTPVRMSDFAKTLGRVLGRPSFFRVPSAVLRLILGEMSVLVLEGQRVRPGVAEALGFDFHFENLELALNDLLNPPT